ncbi:hypothetical protein DIPPA_06840 [Diplonema papillatum]|nr:hypothetical protein DIPPA_06840 [Diplonema papillatum]
MPVPVYRGGGPPGGVGKALSRRTIRSEKDLDSSIESLPYGLEVEECRPRKGFEQNDLTASQTDVHLSVQETSGEVDGGGAVRLGTSFLDRPWHPPEDTTLLSEEYASNASSRRGAEPLPNVLSGAPPPSFYPPLTEETPQFVSHYDERPSETTPQQPDQLPRQSTGTLPVCAGCDSQILGKYYEKEGLTVHVECFRSYLKSAKRSRSDSAGAKSRNRKGARSPQPRRQPPPVPTPTSKGLPSDAISEQPQQAAEPRELKLDGESEDEGGVDDIDLDEYRAKSKCGRSQTIERLMPRDSDGSGSWLAHAESLEPAAQRERESLGAGKHQPPLSPFPSVPVYNKNGRMPSTLLHSLTVSPEAGSEYRSRQRAAESEAAPPSTLDDDAANTSLNIGNISPIPDTCHQREEEDPPIQELETKVTPYCIPHNRAELSHELPHASVALTFGDSQLLEESGRHQPEVTPLRILCTDGVSPPSKTLSTKLESPVTPIVRHANETCEISAILKAEADPAKSLAAKYADDDMSPPRPGASAPEPEASVMTDAEFQHPTVASPRVVEGCGPRPSGNVLIGGGVWRDYRCAAANPPAPRRSAFSPHDPPPGSCGELPDFSFVSQCAVVDSPAPCRRRAQAAPEKQTRNPSPRKPTKPDPAKQQRKPVLKRTAAVAIGVQTEPLSPVKAWRASIDVCDAGSQAEMHGDSEAAAADLVFKEQDVAHLKQQVREMKYARDEARLREEETRHRLRITEDYLLQTPSWERETNRILRMLTEAKLEVAALRAKANPLTAISLTPAPQHPRQCRASLPQQDAPIYQTPYGEDLMSSRSCSLASNGSSARPPHREPRPASSSNQSKKSWSTSLSKIILES